MQKHRCLLLRIVFCLGLVSGLLVIKGKTSADDISKNGTYIDAHLHFSNQVMHKSLGGGVRTNGRWQSRRPTKGRRPPRRQSHSRLGRTPARQNISADDFQEKDFITCADNMIALMNQYGVQKALVMPQPRLSGQPGFYGYKQILPALRKYPGRLFLGSGGGTLNSMIHATEPAQVTDTIRGQFREEALSAVKDGAKVFGELAVLHISLQPKHVFEEATPDHPLFLLLADIAAEHDIPIDIHMEAVVKNTPLPENLRAISKKNPSTLNANIPAFERLLKHNRKAKIVWQHVGWDNVGQMNISLLRKMLTAHPNLYLGFKIEERPYQVGTRLPMPNRIVDENMRIKEDWRRFFEEFPDRILVSSDQFVGIPGRTKRAPSYFKETWPAVKQLPADVLYKVGRNNAAKLYHLDK